MGRIYSCTLTYGNLADIDGVLRPLAYCRVPGEERYVAVDRICRPLVKKLYNLWSKVPFTERNKTVVIKLTERQLEKIEDTLEKHIRDINNDTGPKVDANEQRAFSLKYTALLAKIKKLRSI